VQTLVCQNLNCLIILEAVQHRNFFMTQSDNTVSQKDIFAGMYCVSNDLSDQTGFTLTAICHNEMFFLPSFLEHYRKLGVSRFIIVDDVSDDGSRAFMADQQDVMVLGSAHRYGDRISPPDGEETRWGLDFRVNSIWRKYLLDNYGQNAWSLHVDMDEYIQLPERLTFPDLIAPLDIAEGEVIWAIMLEMTPATIMDMANAQSDKELNLENDWYFDGRQHLILNDNGAPIRTYGGLMARILTQFGLISPSGWRRKLKWWLRREPHRFNALQKPALLYWKKGDTFFSSHRTQKPPRTDLLLPMLHFKFTGALYNKVAFAIESTAYFDGSRKYVMLEELLRRMLDRKASFLGRHSTRFTGFEDLERTGNTKGFQSLLFPK
jgi:hypothetical protein